MSKRGGYIEGVTDNSLKKLRDNDFPDFARLYTSGLESDYMLTHREEAIFGGAVEGVGKYFFLTHKKKQQKGISVDLGFTYKTAGFLPEEVKMQKHFGIRLGTSFALDK